METRSIFPPLTGWEATRDALHGYARAVAFIPRAHAIAHPQWWHISLKVHPDGLVTDNMALPDGGIFCLKMDLHRHQVLLLTSRGDALEFSMLAGLSEAQFRDRLLEAVAGLGLEGVYALEKAGGREPATYDPAAAQKYFAALVNADRVFNLQRARLGGERGPVQLWPHGFDLAFEWFGTRQVTLSEKGVSRSYPAQLNLGFSPGESSHPEPYFYSNPWPFEAEHLLDKPLPGGARWFTGSWQGSLLPYQELVGDDRAEQRLLDYAQAVFQASAPTLLAGDKP
ncbi:MAG TPA: DUF5996 family protein [Anaerolineales bacterium]|nr:DUF5996 family protein [Anaerolineales bacterium]